MKTPYLHLASAATLGLALCLPAAAQNLPSYFLGSAIAATPSQRTVTINADTRWVNVAYGEEVRFVVGSSDFAWKFDGPGARAVDLQQVAPAGLVTRPVTVYVASPPGHRGS